MKTIVQLLTEKLSAAFEKCGYDAKLGAVQVSDRPDLCQFQCNGAFTGAKLYRKAPFMIAKEVAAALEGDDTFKDVQVVGGFINLITNDSFLLSYVENMLADEHLGIPQTEGETVLLDYGGPNVAKPLHIGHLRSAIIGESLKRIAAATGRKVIGDVHLGDWGLQMGLVIAELEERHPDWPCFKEDAGDLENWEIDITWDEISEVYPFASQKSKQDEAFREKAKAYTGNLQKYEPRFIALWKKLMAISIADIKANYERLNVSFDYWYGESDAEPYVEPLLKILTDKGLLHESEGAQVVDVAEETDNKPIPPVIIKKSDGSNIYATTDLATIIQREKDFAPTDYWYVVDNRQSLHLMQVFRCAHKAGLVKDETRLEHLSFGTMNGSDGKPYKTREGGVMRLSDFYNTIYEAALARTAASAHTDGADHEEVAAKIAVAAMKFGDLINHRLKDYVFDMDKFLAPDGKTGSYLLYTLARIHSVLDKAGETDVTAAADVYTDTERQLLLKIALGNEAFLAAYREKAPNIVCESAYQIAAAFSRFYHDNRIISEEDAAKKNAWLRLCTATQLSLEKHLDALGIEPVALM